VTQRASPGERDLRILLGPQWGEVPLGPPPAGTLTLRTLAETLGRFADAVDGADGAPAPDVEEGFTRIQPVVDAALTAWEALKAKGL